MKKLIHRSDSRGSGEYGWLSTRYSFSFAQWFNPERMGFGKLRVINDDIVAPASGFGEHSHKDMEIITIVTRGTVSHRDSSGGVGSAGAGVVQVMSAGSGVVHSEYNNDQSEPLELFQIWIETRARGITPRYEQKSFNDARGKNQMLCVVAPDTGSIPGALTIAQDAYITLVSVADGEVVYNLKDGKNGVYIFVTQGELEVEGEQLGKRDALGICEVSQVTLTSKSGAELLIIEVPMN